MSIGDNIRAARRACNMTQAELAEKVGLSRPTIALYEAGKRELTASQIVPFARVLDTSPLFLLEGTRGGGGGTSLSPPFLPSSTTKSGKSGSGFSKPTLPPVPNAFVLFCFIYIMGTVCGAYMHRKRDCKPYHKHDCKPLPSTVIHSLVHSLCTAYLQPYLQAREVLT